MHQEEAKCTLVLARQHNPFDELVLALATLRVQQTVRLETLTTPCKGRDTLILGGVLTYDFRDSFSLAEVFFF